MQMKTNRLYVGSPLRSRRHADRQRFTVGFDVGAPGEPRIAARQRLGARGLLQANGPWAEHEQRFDVNLIVATTLEPPNEFVLFSVIDTPPRLNSEALGRRAPNVTARRVRTGNAG